jgi:hypothetical protein
MKCGHCSATATRRILWAGGRAFWPVCVAHVQRGLAVIRKNKNPEIVRVEHLKGKVR